METNSHIRLASCKNPQVRAIAKPIRNVVTYTGIYSRPRAVYFSQYSSADDHARSNSKGPGK